MNNRFTPTSQSFEIEVTLNDFFSVKDTRTEKVVGIRCQVFGYLPYNRAAYKDRSKFKKLQASINKGRILTPIVCDNDNGELKIQDGQGRLVAVYFYLLENKDNDAIQSYRIPVFVRKGGRPEDVRDMNETATPWELYDYIMYNKTMDDDNCKKLLTYFNDYDEFKYKAIATHMSKTDIKSIMEGPNEWKPNFEQGKEILDLCLQIGKINPVLGHNVTFSNGIAFLIRKINEGEITDVNKDDIVSLVTKDRRVMREFAGLKIADLKARLLDVLNSNFVIRNRILLDKAKAIAYDRSEGQCEAELHDGTRCPKKTIEYHHDLAHAAGGSNTEKNYRVLCSMHNNAAETNPIKYYDDE